MGSRVCVRGRIGGNGKEEGKGRNTYARMKLTAIVSRSIFGSANLASPGRGGSSLSFPLCSPALKLCAGGLVFGTSTPVMKTSCPPSKIGLICKQLASINSSKQVDTRLLLLLGE